MEMNFDPKKLDSNDIDPKEKKREEKQTRRKRWYRTLCGMAAVVVMCTVYTLMLPALTLTDDQDSSSAAPSGNAVSSEITADSSSGNDSSASDKDSSDTDNSDTDSSASSASETDNNAADKNDSKTDPSDADHSKTDSDSDTDNSSTGEPADSSTAPSQPSDTDSASDTNSDADPDTENGNTVGTIEGTSDGKTDQITGEDPENTDNDNDASDDTDTDDEIKSDDTADVETEADWIATLHDAISADDWDDLTWGEKLLAVAETQLGYTESILNFRTDNDGNHKGYTRYGAWYGNPYGDWCAMFVSFCLNYAGIDTDAIPQDANCNNWVKELEKLNIYEDKDLYVPEPGDIVFFDQDDSGHANHVGIISEVEYGTKTVTRHITKDGSAVEDSTINLLKYINEINSRDDDASGDTQKAELETVEVEVEIAESIKVIEGNSSDRVQYVEYEVAKDKVLGYVSLENAKNVFENNGEEQPEEQPEGSLKYTGEDYTVKIKYTEEAQIPEGTELQVEELEEGTDTYADYYSRAAEKLMENSTAEDEEALDISFARFFDIKLIHDGEEIEPAAPVTVRISYSDRVEVAEDQQATVIHFAKTEATVEDDSTWASHASAMAMPATLALDDENTDSASSDDSSLNNSTSEGIVEVPELIEPKEVKNSVFEFEQSSFSVTATVISGDNADDVAFENGKQYIIYYQSGSTVKAISHSGNSLSLVDLSPAPNDNTLYNDATYSEDILWTYDEGYFYYVDSNNNKKYLDLSALCTKNTINYVVGKYEYYSWDYNMFIADEKPASGLTIRDGKISKTIKDIKYNQTTTAYVHISNNSSLNASDMSTAFKFAKIDEVAEIPPELNITQNLTHKKYVKANDDGTYDLTLTVTGAKGTLENKAKLDVIFILDVSSSMGWRTGGEHDSNGKHKFRIQSAKDAIKKMTKALSANQNLDVTYSLVTFSGGRGYNSDAKINANKYVDVSSFNTTVDDVTVPSSAGTNYQAGIKRAKEITARLGSQKAVIFISDGNPGYYYKSDNSTGGTGTPDNKDEYSIATVYAQKELSTLSTDYLYAVGVAGNYSYLENLVTPGSYSYKENGNNKSYEYSLNVSEANRGYIPATNDTALEGAFETIASNITQVRCKNVSIFDPLSEYAEPTDDAKLVIKRFSIDDSSNVLTSEGGTLTSASLTFSDKLNSKATTSTYITVNATYNIETKTIELNFTDNYELNPEYEFTVTLQIQPTKAAIDKYIELEYDYSDTGDLNTDAPDIDKEEWTSSGKPGFYSNKMNGNQTEAVVKYEYTTGSDGIQTEYYDKPVIQVEVESFELPETGGMGTPLIYLLGAAIIAAPTTIIVARRRRKQN